MFFVISCNFSIWVSEVPWGIWSMMIVEAFGKFKNHAPSIPWVPVFYRIPAHSSPLFFVTPWYHWYVHSMYNNI